jgi:hypothetical protein
VTFHELDLQAYKIARMPRADMESQNGHFLPRRMIFQDLETGTETEILFHSRVVNPPIDEGLFSKTTLESHRRLLRSGPGEPAPIHGE